MVTPAGNTALLGAKLALFNSGEADFAYTSLRGKIQHVALNTDPRFQEVFVEQMAFPSL